MTVRNLHAALNAVRNPSPEETLDEKFKNMEHTLKAMRSQFAQADRAEKSGDDEEAADLRAKGREISKHYKTKKEMSAMAEEDFDDVVDDEDDIVEEANNYHAVRAASLHKSAAEQLKTKNPTLARQHIQSARNVLAGKKPVVPTPMAEEVGSEEKVAVKKPVDTGLDTPDDVKKIKPKEGEEEIQQAKQPLYRESHVARMDTEEILTSLRIARGDVVAEAKSQAAETIQSYLDDSGTSFNDFQTKFNKFLKIKARPADTPEKYAHAVSSMKFGGDDARLVKALFKFTGLSEETLDERVTPSKRTETVEKIKRELAVRNKLHDHHKSKMKEWQPHIGKGNAAVDQSYAKHSDQVYNHAQRIDTLNSRLNTLDEMTGVEIAAGTALGLAGSHLATAAARKLKRKYGSKESRLKQYDKDIDRVGFKRDISKAYEKHPSKGIGWNATRLESHQKKLNRLKRERSNVEKISEGKLETLKRRAKKLATGEIPKQRKRLANRIDSVRYRTALQGGSAGTDADRHTDMAKTLWKNAETSYSSGQSKAGDSYSKSAEEHGLKAKNAGQKQIQRTKRVTDLSKRLKRVQKG